MTVTKKMRRAIWQLTGNWGTLQSQNQGLARGRNRMMSFRNKLLLDQEDDDIDL